LEQGKSEKRHYKGRKTLPLKWINGKPGHGESSNKGTMDFSAT
jgi:hypothetical protein